LHGRGIAAGAVAGGANALLKAGEIGSQIHARKIAETGRF
jgi:gas vesicle protein